MIGFPGKLTGLLNRLIRSPFLFYLAHPQAIGRGVVAGPFAGTSMSLRTTWNRPLYMFFGSYERELHWIWNEFRVLQEMTVWIIGAAEGYYACGLAKKWRAQVTAYEANETSRKALQANIRLNGLQHRIEVRGRCEPSELANRIRSGSPDVLLCDVEGAEDEMFSADILPALKETVLIIEMHPPYGTRSIVQALGETHSVRIINPVMRSVSDYPYRDWIPETIKLAWLDERRPFLTPWLVAVPKEPGPEAILNGA